VTLESIAKESGLSLVEFRTLAPTKAAILCGFALDIDQSMLANLAKQSLSGEPHDRLFDVVLRRLEIMGPYREVLAGILRTPVFDPAEAFELFSSATTSAGWMLAAADVEGDFHWRGVKKLALVHAYWKVLQVWAADDDPGLAKTMAALDRSLRNAQARAETLRSIGQIASGARRIVAAFWSRINKPPAEDS
jgi:hypothetical protein